MWGMGIGSGPPTPEGAPEHLPWSKANRRQARRGGRASILHPFWVRVETFSQGMPRLGSAGSNQNEANPAADGSGAPRPGGGEAGRRISRDPSVQADMGGRRSRLQLGDLVRDGRYHVQLCRHAGGGRELILVCCRVGGAAAWRLSRSLPSYHPPLTHPFPKCLRQFQLRARPDSAPHSETGYSPNGVGRARTLMESPPKSQTLDI